MRPRGVLRVLDKYTGSRQYFALYYQICATKATVLASQPTVSLYKLALQLSHSNRLPAVVGRGG